jgi:hypothetical protein
MSLPYGDSIIRPRKHYASQPAKWAPAAMAPGGSGVLEAGFDQLRNVAAADPHRDHIVRLRLQRDVVAVACRVVDHDRLKRFGLARQARLLDLQLDFRPADRRLARAIEHGDVGMDFVAAARHAAVHQALD